MSSPTHKKHFYTHINLIILALLGCSGVIYGAINYGEYFPNGSTVLQSQTNGWTTPVSGNSKEVMTPEGCKKITSTQGTQAFVPTKTMAEWVSFRDHLPSGMSVNTCVTPCAGALYGGYCWYLSNFGETCDTFCSSHGGCNTTGITNVNNSTYCNALIPLVAPGAGIDANAYADNRIPACTTLTIVTVTNALINNVNPTTCSTPITVTPGNRKRVCSCNN